MNRKIWPWVVGILLFVFILFVAAIVAAVKLATVAARGGEPIAGNIALLHVDGVITSGDSGTSFLGGSSGVGSETLLKRLDDIEKNPGFKAILLRVNSPGGTAAGSQEVYEKLMEIRNTTGKKIVVSMGDVAASGAYYISSSADKIYADPATLTGSIGVIADLMNVQGLYKKLGLQAETLKAGKLKDMGSPNRPMTAEERKVFQTLLDEAHDEFIADVAKGRNLPEATVRRLADGRVYSGEQALRYHLIDALGNLEDAEDAAAKLAGISGEPKVVNMDRRTLFEQLSDPSSESSIRRLLEQAVDGDDTPLKGILFLAPGVSAVR